MLAVYFQRHPEPSGETLKATSMPLSEFPPGTSPSPFIPPPPHAHPGCPLTPLVSSRLPSASSTMLPKLLALEEEREDSCPASGFGITGSGLQGGGETGLRGCQVSEPRPDSARRRPGGDGGSHYPPVLRGGHLWRALIGGVFGMGLLAGVVVLGRLRSARRALPVGHTGGVLGARLGQRKAGWE